MSSSKHVSEEELRRLILDLMIRQEKEKHTEHRPYLYAPTPLPPPTYLDEREEDTSDERGVVIVDI